jgi:Tol biopolymer transport system component
MMRAIGATALLVGVSAVLVGAGTAAAVVPTTTRTSVSSTGVEGNQNSNFPAVSQNGRWTVFESTATNLVPGDTNGVQDVFLHDAKTGETKRIAPPGVQPNNYSKFADISGDGRWIVFQSFAGNLVPGSIGTSDNIYLYDRLGGSVKRLSNGPGGNGGSGNSVWPTISSDGSAVVFVSVANDLVPGDGGSIDAFLYLLADGSLRRVSAPSGGEPNGDVYDQPSVANGGRFVAFTSTASNLVTGDSLGLTDVFVRDVQANTITRANLTSAGGEANGYGIGAAISADGCKIAFQSVATNLVAADATTGTRAFVRDRCAGSTELASLDNSNAAKTVNDERPLAISDNGCLVGMISSAVLATPYRAVIVRDRCQGVTSRIDISTGGDGGDLHTNGVGFSAGSARYVTFHSTADNLVQSDANGANDVFVRDRANAVAPIAQLTTTVDGPHVTADASGSSDPDADIASISIAFGDGTPAVAGVTGSHSYLQAGTYTVTASVLDTDGLTSIATAAVTVSGTAPGPGLGRGPGPTPGPTVGPNTTLVLLSRSSLASRRFAVVPPGKRPVNGRGTKLTLTVSENAMLTLTYEQAIRGRTRKGVCSPTARTGRRCILYRAVGRKLTVAVVRGVNKIPITGRTSAGGLRPGGYRLALVASTSDGRTSKPVRVLLTIVLAKATS